MALTKRTTLDIGPLRVLLVEEAHPGQQVERERAESVKGLNKILLVGVAPAIANAVFRAAGRRVRDLPIWIEAPF